MSDKLKWEGDYAHAGYGAYYMLNKCRIRSGKSHETEYEVSLDGKVIAITDTKADAKMSAQAHHDVQRRKES